MPFPSPGDLPNPGIEPRSPALQADALTSELPGKPQVALYYWYKTVVKFYSVAWSEVKVAQSCPTLQPRGLYSPWNSPGQNTGVGSLSLLQGIFPTQGWNPGLPHCRQILYQLSHKGSPKNTGVGSLSLLKWMFLTQKSNWGLLLCRQILYQLSYQGSPAM